MAADLSPTQLPFVVAYATSETDENPASNIVNASPYSSGWLSLPNSSFPQDLILDFGRIVSLTHLQFVSHQNKIPAHITLFTAREGENWRKAKFQQIDTLQFTDNRQRDYKSRELRSGAVSNVRLRFLKIQIDAIHQNRLNKQNQAGLISVCASGISDAPESVPSRRREVLSEDTARQDNVALADKLKSKVATMRSEPQVPDYDEQPVPARRRGRAAAQPAPPPEPEPEPGPGPRAYSQEVDRPITPAKGQKYNIDDGDDIEPPRNAKGGRRRGKRPVEPAPDLLEFDAAPDGEQQQEEEAMRLQPGERQEAEPFIAMGGEEAVKNFYHSKSGANRVQGVNDLAEIIRTAKPSQHGQLYVRYCHMLRLRLKEEMVGVFTAAVKEMMSLSDQLKLSGDTIRQALEPHLPAIIKRLGDKFKAAKEFVLWAAQCEPLGIPAVEPYLLAPLKKPIVWPNVQEKLNIIHELLGKRGAVDPSFDFAPFLQFVFVTLESKSGEVREKACSVCQVLAQLGAGPQILKMIQSSSLSPQTQNKVRTAIGK
jgi:hypothetical protein